jgi:hypothetical protein
MAPTPKSPGAQRRPGRSKPARELPAESRQGKAPALPKRTPSWSAETKQWWQQIARVQEAILERQDVAAMHAAASGLEDRLGLSPRARRILGWERPTRTTR